jgi:hypothetical protein
LTKTEKNFFDNIDSTPLLDYKGEKIAEGEIKDIKAQLPAELEHIFG